MKSTGLVKLVSGAVMLVACVALLPVVSGARDTVMDGYSVKQAKPPERCVPRHLYASPQPECWRHTP